MEAEKIKMRKNWSPLLFLLISLLSTLLGFLFILQFMYYLFKFGDASFFWFIYSGFYFLVLGGFTGTISIRFLCYPHILLSVKEDIIFIHKPKKDIFVKMENVKSISSGKPDSSFGWLGFLPFLFYVITCRKTFQFRIYTKNGNCITVPFAHKGWETAKFLSELVRNYDNHLE